MKSLISLVLYLCVVTCAHAINNKQVCSFTDTNYAWTGGGAYPRITINNDTLYLISDVSGIWKAKRKAAVWKKSNTGLENLAISNIEFSRTNPLVGYVTTRAGISATHDGGKTWFTIKDLPPSATFRRWDNYRNLAINPVDPNSFIFGDRLGNLYEYSKGQIKTISLPHHFSSPISSLIIFNKGSNLLVGSHKKRALYKKERSSWLLLKQESIASFDFESVTAGGKETVISAGNNYVYISDDKAKSWFKSDISSVVGYDVQVNRVATAVNKNGHLLILVSWSKGWRSGILVSIDNGKSWQNPVKRLHFAKDNPTRSWKPMSFDKIMSVYIDKENTNHWYISTYWGIWLSSDSGKTWTENFKKGAANTVGSSITLAENGDLITASMDIGILRYPRNITKDVNISTLYPNNKNYYVHKQVAGHFWNILVSGKRMIATNSPWDSLANQIVVSEDEGKSWQIIKDGLPEYYATENTIWEKGYAKALLQDPNNKNKFYLGIDGHGLFISDDGGYHWHKSEKQPDNLRIYNGLAVDPINNIIYWGTVGGGVYASTDNGKTWTLDGLQDEKVFDLQAASDGSIYASLASRSQAGAGIAKKVSGSASWRVLKDFALAGTVEAITIDPKQENRIVVGVNGWAYNHNGRLFISNDAGNSWQQISGDFGIGAADMAISPCSNTLYISGYSGGISSINLNSYIKRE